MKTEQIKQMAEAKALEKMESEFPHYTHNPNVYERTYERGYFEAYAQAIIDNYKEPERVNEKLLEALKGLDRFDFTSDGKYFRDKGEFVDYEEMMEAIQSAQQQEIQTKEK